MKCSSRRNCNGEVWREVLWSNIASMKCSSRRNCNDRWDPLPQGNGHASMKCSSRRNCNQLRGDLQGHGVDASMKCSSRRNCNAAGPLHLGGVDAASMKCSSRRNCNSPLSIACHQAHLRPLRERSVRGLGLSRICLQLSPPNPCRSNVLSLRALPEVLRAPERSRQAMSGPSDVMVLVRPT